MIKFLSKYSNEMSERETLDAVRPSPEFPSMRYHRPSTSSTNKVSLNLNCQTLIITREAKDRSVKKVVIKMLPVKAPT